jgi:hypothetical protein
MVGEPAGLQKLTDMPNVFVTMAIDLRPIIDDIANRADEFLADAKNRAQGRAGIEEFITMEHAELGPIDRKKVVDGVMAILDKEDFFDPEFVGDPFKDDETEGPA